MNLATTKNLTILGVIQIVQALAVAATALFDGDPTTLPEWGVLVTSIIAGVGLILAKGAGTTGVQSIGGKPV
jgi:uncharacterized BrkB/YihY/UPF0761 family membrane protein